MKKKIKQGIIVPSDSSNNSIWMVPRKEDKVGNKESRIVIDYRKLNAATRQDKYPI